MNQIEQLCSLTADSEISVKKIIKSLYDVINDVISENNGKLMTSANATKWYINRKVLVRAFSFVEIKSLNQKLWAFKYYFSVLQ